MPTGTTNNQTNQTPSSWGNVDLQRDLANARQAYQENGSLSEEQRESIRNLCYIGENMQMTIQQFIQQQQEQGTSSLGAGAGGSGGSNTNRSTS